MVNVSILGGLRGSPPDTELKPHQKVFPIQTAFYYPTLVPADIPFQFRVSTMLSGVLVVDAPLVEFS